MYSVPHVVSAADAMCHSTCLHITLRDLSKVTYTSAGGPYILMVKLDPARANTWRNYGISFYALDGIALLL